MVWWLNKGTIHALFRIDFVYLLHSLFTAYENYSKQNWSYPEDIA